jgi:putative ABC transport system permease protein
MEPREATRIAARSIRAHKLRSVLTVVGVVIGIASVVTFATFGASLKADVVAEVGQSSANNIYVLGAPEDDRGFVDAPQPVVTTHDVERLRAVDGVRRVVPQGSVPVSALSYRNDTVARTAVTATTPAAFAGVAPVAGRAFESGAREVVVNRPAARLFAENVTVGSTLTIRRQGGSPVEVTVVGVVDRTAASLPFTSFSSGPRFFLPAERFYRAAVESPTLGVNQRAYPQATVVADPARTDEVKETVRRYLREESDAARLLPAGYELRAQTSGDLVDRIQRVIERVTRFVTGIAVIALIVGAIGIANIMLVSVTERTREIGIMKSVGARNRDVMQLFLLEATLLGVAGALLGVPLGLLGGYAATVYAEVQFALAPAWFGIAVAVGVGVGVVAGLYPAWRAARVDPIDALRRE